MSAYRNNLKKSQGDFSTPNSSLNLGSIKKNIASFMYYHYFPYLLIQPTQFLIEIFRIRIRHARYKIGNKK